MSDLTLFRDHARRMANAQHKPECCQCGVAYCCGCLDHPGAHPDWGKTVPEIEATWRAHAEKCPGNPKADPCPGCVTDADRALWVRLADETDAYLARNVDEGLFA